MRFLRNKFAVVWGAGLLAAAVVLLLAIQPGKPFSRLDTMVFDTYQRLKPRVWGNAPVTIVDIDENSLKRIGQWPWPRTVIADLTDRLGSMGAVTIVFDMVFSEPDRTSPLRFIQEFERAGANVSLPAKTDVLDNDVVLAEAFKRNSVISGLVLSDSGRDTPPRPKAGLGFSGSEPQGLRSRQIKAVRNLPLLDEAANGIGHFNFDLEDQADAVVRRATLLKGANGHFYPSLAMEALRVAQGAGGYKIKSSDGSGELSGGRLTLVSTQVGDLEIPTDAGGAINIYHSLAESKPTLPAHAILQPQKSGLDTENINQEIANRIILIGTSAAGLLDLRATPLEPVVPGVNIHADIIDQIISGIHLSRPDIAVGLELIAAVLGALIVLAAMPFFNPLGNGLNAAVVLAAIIGGGWYAFAQHQVLLTPVIPVLCVLSAFVAGIAAKLLITEREGRFVRDAFGHYLSPAMVERLADNPETLSLGGEERQLTLLFCDIRGFTSLSEGLDPTELTELLNDFLTPMTSALLEQEATIDKYMGDAIMAFWNAPIDQDDHRDRACQGLLDMRVALRKLNSRARRPIKVGIGLNTGPCCVGNLGSSQRFNYSAIGDAVNVAARVEGLTKQYGLDNLLAEETLQGVENYAFLEVDRVGVVGRMEPLTVYTLLGNKKILESDLFSRLAAAHNRMLDAYRIGDAEQGLVAMTQAGQLAKKFDDASLARLYAIYADRFATIRETGIPDGWDGVFRATRK